MKKAAAEKAVRQLCHSWRKAAGHEATPAAELSFVDFLTWLRSEHPAYLDFRSTAGPIHDAELWFDQEFKQAWAR